jgi:ParB family chromosome partitioning protein
VEVLTRSGEKSIKATHKRPLTSNTELNALVEQLTTHLGTKVKIMGNQNRGRIEVEYFSREDLERLLDLMTGGQFKQPAPFMMAAAPNSFIQSEAPTQIQ